MKKRSFVVSAIVSALIFSTNASAASSTVVAQLSRDNIAAARDLPPSQSSHDPAPTAPSPLVGRQLKLVKQAGRGGPTAYARDGVLEMGGAMQFSAATNHKMVSVSPMVGYFITNNVQISLVTSLAYNNMSTKTGKTNALNVSVVAEPSLHLPLADSVFVFGGLGAGVAYQRNYGAGFALAPRVGMNVMVGRSGILTPAFNLNWATNRVQKNTATNENLVAINTTMGASIGYSVMF